MHAFNRLVTNVKGADSIDLAPYMVITGGMRVGKSSILDTIRLAITGKHPVGANPSDLSELLPPDAEELYAELHAADGALKWRMDAPRGKGKRSEGVIGHGVYEAWTAEQRANMLVLDHNTMSTFGAERMRRAVMDRFGTLTEVTPPTGLNAAQQALWDKAFKETAGDPAKRLGAMQKWFKAEAKRCGDTAKKAEHTIATLRAHTADVGGADVITLIESQLAKARAFEQAGTDRARADELDGVIADIATAIAQLESIDTEPVRGRIKELEHLLAMAEKGLTKAQTLRILVERADGQTCPCCGTSGVDMSAIHAALVAGIEKREAEKASHIAELSALRAELPDDQLVDARKVLADAQREREGLRASAPEPYNGPSAADLEEKLQLIKEAQSNKQRLDRETDAMHRLLDEQATAKLLERQVTTMLNSYLQQVRAQAEQAVNRYMPIGFEAELRVTDTACQWRMVGRDARSHKSGAYSGSEGGTLALARAQAWGEAAPYRLVLQDDVDLGVYTRKGLQDVFAKLRESVESGLITQAILVWNRPDEIPSDWHVVNLGD